MRRTALSTLVLLACTLAQAEAVRPPQPAPAPGNTQPSQDDTIFRKINDEIKEGKIRFDKQGNFIQDAKTAALCGICGKPLYLHDGDFECLPPDKHVLRIQEVPLTCPACNATFLAAKQGNVNDRNGLDRDFCRHSLGQYAVYSSVWMCPECGYAALATGFGQEVDGRPLGAAAIRFVREKLTAPTLKRLVEIVGLKAKEGQEIPKENLRFGSYLKQPDIPDWIRYENALALLEAAQPKAPHSLLAKVSLEAAHANRRLVCSELGIPGLDSTLQISLGQSIRAMNRYILGECLSVRQQRKESILDPTQPEADPAILEHAAATIIEKGERVVQQEAAQGPRVPAQDQSRFTVGDMFVLRIRHAGFLARLGRFPEAIQALQEARKVIPLSLPAAGVELDARARQYVELQIQLLHRVVDGRLERLQRERELLYKAADEFMQALYFNESPDRHEPVKTAYLIGELLRRDGREWESALAWFQTAEKLLRASGKTLTETEADVLAAWIRDQKQLVEEKARGREPQENVRACIARVLQRAGASAGLPGPAPVPAPPDGTPRITDTTPVTAPNGPKTPDTRVALLKRYYEALKKYRAEKGANPAKLGDLVAEGYLQVGEAGLDANGKLICPETQLTLMYMSKTDLGDAAKPLLFPLIKDANQTRLMGDGRIAEK